MNDLQVLLDALSSPIRREILWLLWDGEQPAGAIAAAVGLSAPTVSEHLAVLRGAGLVSMRASGTFRHYRAQRDTLRALQSLVLDEGAKWIPADDLPERSAAVARTSLAVHASTEVPVDVSTAFLGFVDPVRYSEWLGVPVTIDEGRFAATMEFGTTVRGHYDLVVPDVLIAFRWDFADDGVPLPGGEMTGYLRFRAVGPEGTSEVSVHQLVESEQQAQFMEVAWTMVLGRFHAHATLASAEPPSPRAARPKRRSTTTAR